MAGNIAETCNADGGLCQRAAALAKADLVTDMVGEFPDLQGVMGYYYALHDGEADEVARACADHYLPRFSGDDLPQTPVAAVIALVDRVDTLVGIFAAGEEPSGDKDPFALRRAALGVLRLLIEGDVDLDLKELLGHAAAEYTSAGKDLDLDPSTLERVLGFVMDRLQAYYVDQGFSVDEIAAVAAGNPTRPVDFDRRLRAVAEFRGLDSAANLAAANKRIRNILRQAKGRVPEEFDQDLVQDSAEKELADRLGELDQSVRRDFESSLYAAGLEQLASLRDPVDRFFDEVMVMVEDEALRNNRLALLSRLHHLFLQVADISLLSSPADGN